MPHFSKKSQRNLDTCNPLLGKLFRRVVVNFDCSILEGARSKNRQMTLLDEKKTKLKYPHSKHNVGLGAGRKLADAVDVVPYPIDWRFEKNLLDLAFEETGSGWDVGAKFLEVEHNIQRWFMFIGYVKGIASEMGISLISGADWDGDNCMADQKFDDLPHFEIGNEIRI